MMASSEGVSARSSAAPDSMSATTPKGFTVERSMHLGARRADGASHGLPAASTWTMWPRWRLSTVLAATHLDQHRRRRALAGP